MEELVPGLQAWLTTIEIPSLQATIQASLDSRFQSLESEIAELKAQATQAHAPALALAPVIVPAIVPAITTPAIEPSASFESIPYRADEVGYFDPDLDAEGDMVTVGKDL
jgi:hypothetical protein